MVFMPDEDWDSVLGTSLGGFYNVTQPLLQPMLRHKYGRIVSLASVSGPYRAAVCRALSSSSGFSIPWTYRSPQFRERRTVSFVFHSRFMTAKLPGRT